MARTAVSSRVLVRDMHTSLNLNGTNAYVSRSAANVYSATPYWVAFWMKSVAATDKTIYAEGSSSSDTPVLIIGSGNTSTSNRQLSVFLRNDANQTKLSFVNSTKPVFDGEWHHIIWTDNNGTCALYIDGVADATNFNYTQSGAYTLNRTSFGARVRTTVSNYFPGNLKALRTGTGAVTAAQAAALYRSNIVPSGQNLYWALDEGEGTSATDGTGNGNTGTITNATYSREVPMRQRKIVRHVPYSLDFLPSTGADVTIENSAGEVWNGTDDLSVSFWFKSPQHPSGTSYLFSIPATGGDNRRYVRQSSDRKLNVAVGPLTLVEAVGNVILDQWHHVVLTTDTTNSVWRLYYDGVLTKDATAFTPGTGTADITIGNNTDSSTLGSVAKQSEVRIWNRVLTTAEVIKLYYDNVVPTSGLRGQWLLNEGSGTTATDTSGNGRNGVISGATWTTDAPFKARSVVASRNLVT